MPDNSEHSDSFSKNRSNYGGQGDGREISFLDRCVSQIDQALRTCVPGSNQALRSSPAQSYDEEELDSNQRRHIAGLMRINHTGEVCAQALYQGRLPRLSSMKFDNPWNRQQSKKLITWPGVKKD